MTSEQYAKIKALAEDQRTDPVVRSIAQRQIDKWKDKMEGSPKVVPGMRRSPEYEEWVKGLHIGSKREPR